MKHESRSAYWNEEYVKYWKEKVNHTNNLKNSERQVRSNDVTSPDSIYFKLIKHLNILDSDVVLDVGCGYGRSLKYLSSIANSVIGVDISSQMIDEAKLLIKDIENIQLLVSEGESINISSSSINKIICFAAFDAMYQKEALIEFNRIMKIGGEVLITGKNNFFKDDDYNAIAAEIGARKKGHPNYFTDVKALFNNISKFGFEIVHQAFYLKRGDFGINKAETSLISKFYEFSIVLKKISIIDLPTENLPTISNSFSLSYLEESDK